MDILAALLFIAFAGWFWSDSTRAKEKAIAAAKGICQQTGVQLLDQTVTLASIKPTRTSKGNMTFQRIYRFEFCTTGTERFPGFITMRSHHVLQSELEHPEGKIIN